MPGTLLTWVLFLLVLLPQNGHEASSDISATSEQHHPAPHCYRPPPRVVVHQAAAAGRMPSHQPMYLPFVHAYTTQGSFTPGSTVPIYVSADTPYTVTVWRLGRDPDDQVRCTRKCQRISRNHGSLCCRAATRSSSGCRPLRRVCSRSTRDRTCMSIGQSGLPGFRSSPSQPGSDHSEALTPRAQCAWGSSLSATSKRHATSHCLCTTRPWAAPIARRRWSGACVTDLCGSKRP